MKTNQTNPLKWYSYVAAFFAGAFLANFIPHFVQGISGNTFPSPFGNPPGLGNSSPVSNVLWGAFNLLIGYLLFTASKTDKTQRMALMIFYVGIVAQGVMLSMAFSNKI